MLHDDQGEMRCSRAQECPLIRYRAVAPEHGTSALEPQALVAQRVAINVHDQLLQMQKAGQLPAGKLVARSGWHADQKAVCCSRKRVFDHGRFTTPMCTQETRVT